ncbi:DUF2507 domain-containing protein [Salipaludibacillus keqinensis]|jgi:hypothetical protein|nr:DUF2507 domain-containing protein [Salipaludibacillus keqinensis]
MPEKLNHQDETQPSQVPAFSYDLIRHELIPELLGEDEGRILYWAGKSLARKQMDLNKNINPYDFFTEAHWGSLQTVKESKSERIYELASSHQENKRPFTLEAGFLAQFVEIEKGVVSESSYAIKRNKPLTITITVRWDKKDPANS